MCQISKGTFIKKNVLYCFTKGDICLVQKNVLKDLKKIALEFSLSYKQESAV